jgi:multiple sugar transport system substrate-binding protein
MYDGALYAMWDSTDTRVLWYNMAIFEEAGLDPNQPPTTWKN